MAFFLDAASVLLLVLGFTLPFSDGPLTTFHLEWLAALGWLMLAVTHFLRTRAVRPASTVDVKLLLSVAAALLVAILLDLASGRFVYKGQGVLRAAYIAAAMAACWLGWQVFSAWRLEDRGTARWRASSRTVIQVVWALVIAASLNGALALSQYLGLHLPAWMEVPLPPGMRASGNLRQANLYALLMMLGIVSTMALSQWNMGDSAPKDRARRQGWLMAIAVFLGATASLSLSRTGAVMMWAICIGAWAGPALSNVQRIVALAATLSHGAAWFAIHLADKFGWLSYQPLNGVQVIPGGGNFTSFRSEIWAGMLRLVADHPFIGAGTGGAGYAYFMRELPVRIDLNMQHAHNLPMQLAVESGVVFALAWLALIAILLWRVRSAWTQRTGRLLALALLAFAIHSNLEYPLWYLYFLLPFGFALGGLTAMGSRETRAAVGEARPVTRRLASLGVCAALVLACIGIDYQRILPAFRGTSQDALNNLERAYGTWLFTYCVDYVVVANVAVTPENARIHYNLTKRLSRTIIQPFTLINLALASGMLGKTDEAAFYLRRIQEMSDTGIQQVWNKLTPEERVFLLPAMRQLGAIVS